MVLHELNNHTQYLSALGALETAGESLAGRGDGLARTGKDVEELGWLLGLCAGALGTDLLRDRTERQGLAPLVRLVRKALRREGRDLERADRMVPDLHPRLGWRGALRVGSVLYAAARGGADPLAFELESDGTTLLVAVRARGSVLGGETASPDPSRGQGWCRVRIDAEDAA